MESRPRALLLITHLEPGGAQETVMLLAKGLRERGYEVAVASGPGAEQARLDRMSVPFVPLEHMAREVSPGTDARAFRELQSLVKDEQVDVVHSHSSKAGVLGRVAARFSGVPAIVHTSHGLPVNPDMDRKERGVLLAAERLASYFCHKVVAVSRATASELLDLHLARKHQIEVIPSGVDLGNRQAPDPVAARETLRLGRRQPVLGWVGRHFAQKRPDHLVLAAKRVLERVPDAAVVLAGDGPLLEETRAATGGDPRIKVLGHRPDVENVFAAMDVMMLTSAWEGLPRTVLEAQAAGKPVVSTDVNGIPEVVKEGETGYLAHTGEWVRLADAAVKLLEDGSLRHRMGKRARQEISDFYSADHMVDATAQMYWRLLADGAAKGRS